MTRAAGGLRLNRVLVPAVAHEIRQPWLSKVTPMLMNCPPAPVGDLRSELCGATTATDTRRGHAPGSPAAPE